MSKKGSRYGQTKHKFLMCVGEKSQQQMILEISIEFILNYFQLNASDVNKKES